MYVEKNKSNSRSGRIGWIDFVRGVTLILVIIGHTVSEGMWGSLLRGLIYSFHMPLFFILSGMTAKNSADIDEWKRRSIHLFKKLIGPALALFVLSIGIDVFKSIPDIPDLTYWTGKFYTLIFASGVELTFNDIHVNALGVSWFFFALFAGRCIFDYLQLAFDNKQLTVVSVMTGMIGICISTYQWLPFSLDIALAVIPFFYFGSCLRQYVKNTDIGTGSPMIRCIVLGGGMAYKPGYSI